MTKRANVSIFVPHAGCPHTCSFCNQRTITGSVHISTGSEAEEICRRALKECSDVSHSEIAFFGGSFTAILRDYMLELLQSVQKYLGNVSSGGFKGIRISTRPDCISTEILDILKKYHVTSIELGAQSMCDKVLAANERGHTSAQVEKAAEMIKKYGCFELGLQMMVGLYKSNENDEIYTWERICKIHPDTVRIYPVAILEGTKLGELFKSGEYVPMNFETVVDLCADFLIDAERKGIKVIKLGLHSSVEVEENLLGGFYHPAFREICESRIFRRVFEEKINEKENVKYAHFLVDNKNLSKALGQKKSNIMYFKNKGITLEITPKNNLKSYYEIYEIK